MLTACMVDSLVWVVVFSRLSSFSGNWELLVWLRVVVGSLWVGSLDRASVAELDFPLLYSITKSYPSSLATHFC